MADPTDAAERLIRSAPTEQRFQALYLHDTRGRITAINQWDGGAAPRFHLIRTPTGNAWRFRADQPDALVAELTAYCQQEPVLAEPPAAPRHAADYQRLLGEYSPIDAVWSGPAYRFPDQLAAPAARVAEIGQHNAVLLRQGMADWLPDVPHRRPFMAVIESDQAVAVCASVRISATAHEAGVETQAGHRRRGHASSAVVAWARAVASLGAMPLYSTSWQNAASQAVARRLGLRLAGVDYHLR